jgi:hypothetical protein
MDAEVFEHFACIGVPEDSAWRHEYKDIGPVAPMHILPHPGLTAFGLEILLIAQLSERAEVPADFEDDVPSPAPIPSGRPSKRNELLAPERDASITPFAGGDGNDCFVGEFYHA